MCVSLTPRSRLTIRKRKKGNRFKSKWAGRHSEKSGPNRQVRNTLNVGAQTGESGTLTSAEAMPVGCWGTDTIAVGCEMEKTKESKLLFPENG